MNHDAHLPQAPVIRRMHGQGLITRCEDVLLVCAHGGGTATPAPGLDLLLAAFEEALATPPPRGSALTRRLVALIARSADGPRRPVVALGVDMDGLTVLAHGDAQVEVSPPRGAGSPTILDARESVVFADRRLTGPVATLRVALDGGAVEVLLDGAAGTSAPDRSPFTAAGSPPRTTSPFAPPDVAPTVTTRPVSTRPVTAGPVPTPDPALATSAVFTDPVRAVPRPPATPVAVGVDVGPVVEDVLGVRCPEGHFNDPKAAYCSGCGTAMVHVEPSLSVGPRPQVGILLGEDGRARPVRGDMVVGRRPQQDPAVASGAAAPVLLEDEGVSPVHSWLMVDGWDVRLADAGSEQGTYVAEPDGGSWRRLDVDEDVLLRAGTLLAVGPCRFRFHVTSTARGPLPPAAS